jgi:hypothetical protein
MDIIKIWIGQSSHVPPSVHACAREAVRCHYRFKRLFHASAVLASFESLMNYKCYTSPPYHYLSLAGCSEKVFKFGILRFYLMKCIYCGEEFTVEGIRITCGKCDGNAECDRVRCHVCGQDNPRTPDIARLMIDLIK